MCMWCYLISSCGVVVEYLWAVGGCCRGLLTLYACVRFILYVCRVCGRVRAVVVYTGRWRLMVGVAGRWGRVGGRGLGIGCVVGRLCVRISFI